MGSPLRGVVREQFVKSRADKLPGHERDLAQVTESIHLCAALKTASAADLVAAFVNQKQADS